MKSMPQEIECFKCGGKGINKKGKPCKKCGGTGKLNANLFGADFKEIYQEEIHSLLKTEIKKQLNE